MTISDGILRITSHADFLWCIGEPFQEKKLFCFGHCPKLVSTPPSHPFWTQLRQLSLKQISQKTYQIKCPLNNLKVPQDNLKTILVPTPKHYLKHFGSGLDPLSIKLSSKKNYCCLFSRLVVLSESLTVLLQTKYCNMEICLHN